MAGVFIIVSIQQSIKWLNRHGTTLAVLVLLLNLCAMLHFLAVIRIHELSSVSANWDESFLRKRVGIEFVHHSWWLMLPYIFFSFYLLIYLEVRSLPRWAVWCSFIFLALPVLGYAITCMRVIGSAAFVMGTTLGS